MIMTGTMKMSAKGISFLEGLEGKRNKAYKDSQGYWTIGVGHLIKPNEQSLINATLTDKQVDDLFKSDLAQWETAANNGIKVPLKQNEFDAVISILYNIGKGYGDGIGTDASFINDINNRGSKAATLKDIMKFHNPSEIIPRRAKEARLFDTGNYNTSDLTNLQSYENLV